LGVVFRLRRLDGPEGEVSRESPSNEVGDRGSKGVDEDYYHKFDQISRSILCKIVERSTYGG
jgi:hypothetical protein